MVDVQIISALIFPTYINLESIDDYTHCKSTLFQQSVDPLVDPWFPASDYEQFQETPILLVKTQGSYKHWKATQSLLIVHGNWSFPSIHMLIKRSQLMHWIWSLDVGSTTSNHLHVLQIGGGYLYHLLLVFRFLIRCNQFPALLVVDPVDIRYPSGFPFPAVMDTMSHGYNSVTQRRYCII